ncbi:PadR family transcriptional regulator [Actinoplanes sp. SE50]|uniref:PadR family transcriptional regulator n=1 Tax=unclassified Actinoplanes TaxID=2626549 RepID=UPI00023EBB13|nr:MULTISPECIES: PadR family transcriptional regulator [unclassified Actinoplanes]AEV82305.1 Negative transcription regulator padR [Actinoplanes sp. SE50/110]ATO80702.1 PadR family transcriptional regulator [Actinoplanes sp. SE50]SLL98109.1 PadR family transcriptional regulator [Actinoplanes sp. SE50/110]
MLALAILGFLHDEPLHGYELKDRIRSLTGHVRAVSDGALYPAINRLTAAGLLERRTEPGTSAAPRQMLSLTGAGRAELLSRLRSPSEVEITDRNRYFTILAFLRHLPDPADQAEVLRRRLAFLAAPATFFSQGGTRLRAADVSDPFRRGMFEIARATSQAERAWLERTLATLTP